MSAAERLTYLLGIAAAVIGWAVTQLSASITADAILGYTITRSQLASGNSLLTLDVENLSKSFSPDSITITAPAAPGCVKAMHYEPSGFAIAMRSDAATTKDRSGANTILFPYMRPGTSFRISIEYVGHCWVVPKIDVNPGGSGHVRLLKRGIETFIVRTQFLILLLLTGLFAVVFLFTFAGAYRLSSKQGG